MKHGGYFAGLVAMGVSLSQAAPLNAQEVVLYSLTSDTPLTVQIPLADFQKNHTFSVASVGNNRIGTANVTIDAPIGTRLLAKTRMQLFNKQGSSYTNMISQGPEKSALFVTQRYVRKGSIIVSAEAGGGGGGGSGGGGSSGGGGGTPDPSAQCRDWYLTYAALMASLNQPFSCSAFRDVFTMCGNVSWDECPLGGASPTPTPTPTNTPTGGGTNMAIQTMIRYYQDACSNILTGKGAKYLVSLSLKLADLDPMSYPNGATVTVKISPGVAWTGGMQFKLKTRAEGGNVPGIQGAMQGRPILLARLISYFGLPAPWGPWGDSIYWTRWSGNRMVLNKRLRTLKRIPWAGGYYDLGNLDGLLTGGKRSFEVDDGYGLVWRGCMPNAVRQTYYGNGYYHSGGG